MQEIRMEIQHCILPPGKSPVLVDVVLCDLNEIIRTSNYRFGFECLTTSLLESAASPATRNAQQRTPLHLSCLAGHIEVSYIFFRYLYYSCFPFGRQLI